MKDQKSLNLKSDLWTGGQHFIKMLVPWKIGPEDQFFHGILVLETNLLMENGIGLHGDIDSIFLKHFYLILFSNQFSMKNWSGRTKIL